MNDAVQQQIDDSKKRVELLESQKRESDARRALVESRLPSIPLGDGFAGNVTVKPAAGTEEVALLATKCIGEAATIVALAIRPLGTRFIVRTGTSLPARDRLLDYRARRSLAIAAFDSLEPSKDAIGPSDADAVSDSSGGGVQKASYVGALPPVLDVATRAAASIPKLLAYLKGDYEIGGIEASVDASLLVAAMSGALRRTKCGAAYPAVSIAAGGSSASRAAALERLDAELSEISGLIADANARLAGAYEGLAENQSSAADGDAVRAAAARAEIPALQGRIDALESAIAGAAALATELGMPEGPGGTSRFAGVARELAEELDETPAGTVTLLVTVQNTGGEYATKRSLLSGIFSMPFYTSGGASVSYVLVNAAGDVLAADVVAIYSGLVRTDRIRDVLTGVPSRNVPT